MSTAVQTTWQCLEDGDMFEQEFTTPRCESWGFATSCLSLNSSNGAPVKQSGESAFTPALYRSQPDNLYTGVGFGYGLDLPQSFSVVEGNVQNSSMIDIPAVESIVPSHETNSFDDAQQQQRAAHMPSSSILEDTRSGTMEQSILNDESLTKHVEAAMQNHCTGIETPSRNYDISMAASTPSSAGELRLQVTLHAPTAMAEHVNDVPVTYLNKGQVYYISVVDTVETKPLLPGTHYRTSIRISFDDEQDQQGSASRWQIWEETRGTRDALDRDGRLRAIELVEDLLVENDYQGTRVDFDKASFDGFSVIWMPAHEEAPGCNVSVRFNVLSTDFTRSKGVQAASLRLCAKTEVRSSGSVPGHAELVFCKAKVFRDHGAERKLSNDTAQAMNTIDKLKRQVADGDRCVDKVEGQKRRGSVSSKKQQRSTQGRIPRNKWTRPTSSNRSTGCDVPVEDPSSLLRIMVYLLSSASPVSRLCIPGSDQDDPDLALITLTSKSLDPATGGSRYEGFWQQASDDQGCKTRTASLVSLSSSLTSQSLRETGKGLPPEGNDCQPTITPCVKVLDSQQLGGASSQLTNVSRTNDAGRLTGYIEVVGVDPFYKPPVDNAVKPVACVYILHRNPRLPDPQYHRAVYLTERTVKAFTKSIALKWDLEPTNIARLVRILPGGLEVEVDDHVIRELANGQDMIMEVFERKCRSW
ncbi:CP2 transcription factor [Cadophora sp. MPI-SDFR-AT-0126]|nr:CP2 transcription factor [Leotiomycetes sp. MPI-SDFR-AT-0126]